MDNPVEIKHSNCFVWQREQQIASLVEELDHDWKDIVTAKS
ncbi:hypothetical protein N9383_00485 [Granulosicoccus sp.]|nr:hypothetical protein [Granulosicoccus sp.]